MQIGILGSGFGIYGYLPAICQNNWKPIVLSKNKIIIENRPELRNLKNKIKFAENETKLIELSERLVVARDPQSQVNFLHNYKILPRNQHLYLEKPLTPDLSSRNKILQLLQDKSFSIAYLFRYTFWFQEILETFKHRNGHGYEIYWNVPNLNSTWKFQERQGGGLLLNYGIHFLAILNLLDFTLSDIEIIDREKLFIYANNKKSNVLKVIVQTSTSPQFSINRVIGNCSKEIYFNDTPFGSANSYGEKDNRVGLLSIYLKDAINKNSTYLELEMYISNLLNITKN
jgi:hypothetical protein